MGSLHLTRGATRWGARLPASYYRIMYIMENMGLYFIFKMLRTLMNRFLNQISANPSAFRDVQNDPVIGRLHPLRQIGHESFVVYLGTHMGDDGAPGFDPLP